MRLWFWCLFFQNVNHSSLVSKSCYSCLQRLLQLFHAEFLVFLDSFSETQVLR